MSVARLAIAAMASPADTENDEMLIDVPWCCLIVFNLDNSVVHCVAVIVDPALTADTTLACPYPASPVPAPKIVLIDAAEVSPVPAAFPVANTLYSSSSIASLA